MNTTRKKTAKKPIITAATVAVFCSTLALPALAENPESNSDRYTMSEPELRNAWLEGKLETALLVNRNLNNFSIDNEVRNGKATLTGSVKSEIDRELAEQVAYSIEGITDVDNQVQVEKADATTRRDIQANERSFSQKFDDMTTTAAIKSKLLANQSTEGLAINVDTANRVVSLSGNVATTEEKQLAEKIAENTDGVDKVKNLLEII